MDCFASLAMTMWRQRARHNNPIGGPIRRGRYCLAGLVDGLVSTISTVAIGPCVRRDDSNFAPNDGEPHNPQGRPTHVNAPVTTSVYPLPTISPLSRASIEW